MNKFSCIITRISIGVGRAASFLLLALVGIIVYEVIARYLFNAPTKWSNEISQYVLAAVAMLGGALCLAEDSHVRVDILFRNYQAKTKAVVEVITFLMVLTFVVAILWKGGDLCLDALAQNKRSMTILQLPLFPSMVMVLVGAFLLGVQSLAKALLATALLLGRANLETKGMYEA